MSSSTETSIPEGTRQSARPANWPLWIGGGLVLVILLLAIFGPSLAPRDPREHNQIIQIDGQWLTPPYSAFTPGFPLGSDNLGRDLYSWLLWSVRPTLTLVVIVASLRMVLGLWIGVTAGWSDRLPGRAADGLIAGALAVPSLIASLIVITAIGFRLGVWAFVVGLSVTGWAETAQLVRERTRTVRGQDAVEAARALGASSAQTFLLHILPQVMPMIWMLLAFEISQTLVTTAGLGFLGYYLGGAVFTEVDDFVYQRISEMPELGQMLATAWLVLDEPWAMVAAGTVVFLIVLAFNLVGEGLQHRLTRKLGGARVLYLRAAGDVIPWIDEHITAPVSALLRRRSFQVAMAVVILVAIGAGLAWRGASDAVSPVPGLASPSPTAVVAINPDNDGPPQTTATLTPTPVSAFPVPGDHIWANEDHDPWRARWLSFTGPVTTTVQWSFEIEGSFTGGPVIDRGGTLYVPGRRDEDGAQQGLLYALDAEGGLLWQTELEADPVGAPALDAGGTIYVADRAGLTAVSSQGDVLWRANSPDGEPAMSGPVAMPDTAIVYKTLSGVVAVDPSGAVRWHTPISESMSTAIPHLSADAQTVLWSGLGFHTTTGDPVAREVPPIAGERHLTQVVVGADGEQYWQLDVLLVPEVAAFTEQDAVPLFDLREVTWQGADAGVTPDGRPWLAARPSVGGMGLGFFWGDEQGGLTGKFNAPGTRNFRILSVDAESTAYICMDAYESATPMCLAMGPDSDRPLWRLPLRGIGAISGASLAPGRLYVTTWDGDLLAIGDAAPAAAVPSGTTATGSDSEPEMWVPTFDQQPLWTSPAVPGDHPWPMPRRDAYGTLWTDVTGPGAATTQWALEQEAGFSGGPVVAADGTVYVGTLTGSLLAVDAQGDLVWQATLPAPAVGTPALGGDGTIYVTDQSANLLAFDPGGAVLWRYHPWGVITETRRSSSGKILSEETLPLDGLGPAGAGPIVAPDGTIYYTMGVETYGHETAILFRSEVMVAVSPEGRDLLARPLFTWSDRLPARLSVDGSWVLWGDIGYLPTPASYAAGASPGPYVAYLSGLMEEDDNLAIRTVIGADGRAYFVRKHAILSWYLSPQTLVVDRVFEWDPEVDPGTAADGGATADGNRWLFFRNGTFVWITADDEVYGPVRFPLESQLIGLDAVSTAYGCGSSLGRTPECMAYIYRPYAQDPGPSWRIALDEGVAVLGGALSQGTLYVTANGDRTGWLYALGD